MKDEANFIAAADDQMITVFAPVVVR